MGIALLATPALAQDRIGIRRRGICINYQTNDPAGMYPNPIARSGSAAQVQSGAAFDTDRGY